MSSNKALVSIPLHEDDWFEKQILHKTDWLPLITSVGGVGYRKFSNLAEKYGVYGIYQVAHKDNLPENIIDPNIGYSGKATNVFARSNGIKTRKGKHQCRVYLNSKGIDVSDVYIRYLFTEKGKEGIVEAHIFSETEAKYGHRFAWREASSGQDGNLLRILDNIEKVENLEDLRTIAKVVRDKAKEIFINDWLIEEEE
jgi:hypothetical protein